MTDSIHQPMEQMEQLAEQIRAERDRLKASCEKVQDQTRAILREHAAGIQRRSESIAVLEKQLADLVGQHPSLFKKPRTKVLHGIKFGLRKLPGKITWKKADTVVARIKEKLSIADAARLIRTEEVPDKEALAQLPAQTLRALGVSVVDASDTPVVTPTDTDLDKMVAGFVDAAEQAVREEAA